MLLNEPARKGFGSTYLAEEEAAAPHRQESVIRGWGRKRDGGDKVGCGGRKHGNGVPEAELKEKVLKREYFGATHQERDVGLKTQTMLLPPVEPVPARNPE